MSKKHQKGGSTKAVSKVPMRSVDKAMRTNRSAKQQVRQKWLDVLKEIGLPGGKHPIYLTLPGAEGRDVQLLIDEKLISVTETGAIAEDSLGYCVAVESSPLAVLELQRRFPGLRILEQNISGILRGDSLLAYPDHAHRANCQAHVVNLDLQATLHGVMEGQDASFSILRWIEKFGTLHLECPHQIWHLFLTLNATIEWSADVCEWVSAFLQDNFKQVASFRLAASRLLDADLIQAIEVDGYAAFNTLPLSSRQRVLLVLIPKAICHRLSRQGWQITTKFNAEYPGTEGAPMVTYIFGLTRAGQAAQPGQLYTDALASSLDAVHQITEEGVLKAL